ncbi:hypothetical protein N7522_001205 [Penicillium canescens]|nr:hypothetical protein N7522_001205 [Penicillium canescens]
MPSFFVPGHGLPTPPHVNGGRMDDPSFYPVGHAGFPPRYHQSGNEFIEQYSQSLCYAKPTSMNLHPQSAHPMYPARDLHALNQQAMFNPLAATLPPIRSNVQLPPMESSIPPQYRRQEAAPMQRPEQPRKEEKATGGVAAHLDYEMDRMSDFVAEMAQGMIFGYSPVSEIRLSDFVFDSSAQLHHLARSVLSGQPDACALGATRRYQGGNGQVYRMLTVSLLLGSKFLDDNTFQNKSWAEVSNIPVAELNRMELEWLFAFDWKIHDRIYDKQDGFASWRAHWDTWSAKATARAQETRQTLSPLETNVLRSQGVTKPLMSPEGPIPPQYQRGSNVENSWLNPTASEYSPPSALSSGPNTPDYYSVGPWGYSNPLPPPPYSRGWNAPPQYMAHQAPRSQPPSYHHTPAYGLPFAQSVWTGHGSSCGCTYCAKHLEHYMSTSAFPTMQPIIAA